MRDTFLCELKKEDKDAFIQAMQRSSDLHHPWVKSPQTDEEFENFYQRSSGKPKIFFDL